MTATSATATTGTGGSQRSAPSASARASRLCSGKTPSQQHRRPNNPLMRMMTMTKKQLQHCTCVQPPASFNRVTSKTCKGFIQAEILLIGKGLPFHTVLLFSHFTHYVSGIYSCNYQCLVGVQWSDLGREKKRRGPHKFLNW